MILMFFAARRLRDRKRVFGLTSHYFSLHKRLKETRAAFGRFCLFVEAVAADSFVHFRVPSPTRRHGGCRVVAVAPFPLGQPFDPCQNRYQIGGWHMFEGTLEEFKAYIEHEWAWGVDGYPWGDEWDLPMSMPELRPKNPANYLDELEEHFGNELSERLDWAKKGNDPRVDGLQAAIERWNTDEPLRKAFCLLVRQDIGRIQIEESPYLEKILLFEAAGFELKPKDFRTVLHEAARRDYGDSITHLVSKGFDLDAVNGDGKTPLDIANRLGRENAIAAIMSAKAQKQADTIAEKHNITLGNPRSRRGSGGKPL